jgi:hypothetical protein
MPADRPAALSRKLNIDTLLVVFVSAIEIAPVYLACSGLGWGQVVDTREDIARIGQLFSDCASARFEGPAVAVFTRPGDLDRARGSDPEITLDEAVAVLRSLIASVMSEPPPTGRGR